MLSCPGSGCAFPQAARKTWQAFYRVDGRMVREKLGTLGADPERRRRARARPAEHDKGAHRGESRRRAAPEEEEERRQAEAEEARKKNTLAAVIDRYLAERPADKSRKPMRAEYLAETPGPSRRT